LFSNSSAYEGPKHLNNWPWNHLYFRSTLFRFLLSLYTMVPTESIPVAPAAAAPQATADHGWGSPAAQPSEEQHLIEEVVAAKEVCDYQYAEQAAAVARKQYPANAWLKQNYTTIRTLAQRDRNFRRAMRSARLALGSGRPEDSFAHLQTAMQNASKRCGQDQNVRGLHAEARQMLASRQDQAVRQARQFSDEQRPHGQARRARDEQAPRQREADALEVQKRLLETLETLNGKKSNTRSAPANTNQGDDWLERARPKIEQNETWQKWQESQK
jgi:hypothetical protein